MQASLSASVELKMFGLNQKAATPAKLPVFRLERNLV
jgi:hypothetical protein